MKIVYPNIMMVKELASVIRGIILDSPYYSDLAKKEVLKTFKQARLEKEIKDKSFVYLVAIEGNKIIGFCVGIYEESDLFWIEWIGVIEEYRRRDVGGKLLHQLERRLKRKGIHKIGCSSRINNKESNAAIRKYGFKKVALARKYWFEQDFYLWKKII